MYRNYWLIGIFVIFIHAALASPVYARECQRGQVSHPASQYEASIISMPVGTDVCPADVAVGINDAVGQAEQQLGTMWCGNKPATCGPYNSSLKELDPKFAVCAAKFITAVRQRDSSICIESAYRSQPHQDYLCSGRCGGVAGPCAKDSNHKRGIAIDIQKPNSNTLPAFVHQMAQQGGGVSFPVNNDDGHMQPASESGDCSTPGYIAPGNGNSAVQTPTQSLMNSLRQMFAPQQPKQPSPSTPLPSASQPTGAFTSSQPPNSSGGGGSTGSSGSAGDTSQGEPPTITPPPPAASELINALALPTVTATTPATGTVITLSNSLNNTSSLTPETAPVEQAAHPSPSAQEAVESSPNPPPSTFTSNDLHDSSQQAYAPTTKSTFMMQTLETLKQILLKALALLQPFRGLGRSANSATVMME